MQNVRIPQLRIESPFWRWITRLGLISFSLFVIVCAVIYFSLLSDLPPTSAIEERRLRPSTQILDRNGRLLYEVVDENAGKQISLDLDRIPQTCVDATLATEDERFYSHPGFDPVAIARAVVQNWRAGAFSGGRIASGGSTLTQQVARNLLMDPDERYEQSYRRKVREVWLAWRLELRYTKSEILALYLDQAYYGNFAYGLEAAAEVFFAKPAPQLSKAECALLAGLIQYPVGYNPLIDPEAAKGRQLTVLRLLEESDFVSAEESRQIARERLRYKSKLFEIEAPHFVMAVQEMLGERLGQERLRQGGLRVHTTLDLTLQHQAERSVRHRLEQLNCQAPGNCTELTDPNRRVDNAAAIILDSRSGEVLTMVGSPDYFDASIQGNLNATLTLRQPGSAIKPFTYAAAMDPQWQQVTNVPPLTPANILADLPVSYPVKEENGEIQPYTPINYDRTYHGPVSVRAALANSYNIPTVKLLNRIGVKTLQSIAAQSGIPTFTSDHGLALTLGSGEVRLLDLASAYGIFLNGHPIQPKAILKIEGMRIEKWRLGIEEQGLEGDYQLSTINHQPPTIDYQPSTIDHQPIISPEAAYLITDILSDNRARIPAFGANSVLNLPFPAAAKTGTTTDWRDNWTIGYSTERIIGTWVGNADNAPMLDVSGIDGAGPIWHDLMLAAHPKDPPPFRRPSGISETMVCAPSGLLPTPLCPKIHRETFIQGSEPTVHDDQFTIIDIDLHTNMRATQQTPPERITERVYWSLPAEYREWMVSNGIDLPPPFPSEAQVIAWSNDESGSVDRSGEPLVLTAPVGNSIFRIAPGVPPNNQRIELTGFVNGNHPWRHIRLIKDGEVVSANVNVDHISTWWTLEAGTHRFWLEGTEGDGGEVIRSLESVIVVEG